MPDLVRLAVPADADRLVDLRAAMFDAMGQDPAATAWRDAARSWFADRLAGDDVLIAVADLPGFGVVASAMAELQDRAPSPGNPSGRSAHVSQVSTLPEHRRRGHARACVVALLAELDDRGVHRTDLFATADGDALYRDLGFRAAPYPALRRP